MKAVVIERPGEVRVKDVPTPDVKPDEVLVRVAACGVCGTDLHVADGEFPPTPYPITPGHEFAGVIAELGSNVSGLAVGDRVAVDPSLFCNQCHFCLNGKGNLCENWGGIGVTTNGAFAEYVSVPAANAYPIPDDLPWRDAALIEPVSCAVHGIHVLQPQLGDRVLIVGAGTMGLILLQLMLRSGTTRVSMLDVNAERLVRAEKLGAAATATGLAELTAEEPRGFDCVIDATGSASAMEQAFSAVKRGGKFLVFGVASPESQISLSPFRIYNDEITILGSMAVLHSYGQAVDLIADGAIATDELVTDEYSLDEFPDALENARKGIGLKSQIVQAANPS